ncbi:MAG TPA: arsenate reductase (glutaredoxin), partial [Actinomycetota bacterium]|nr:arsenate reductase (glutaredoxin) [Actinomycetota bacterium]
MGPVTIFYNGACSKCRGTMELLRERGIEPEVVEYLSAPPTAEELRELSAKLGLPVRELVRTSEPRYAELGLDDASEDELVEALAREPVLLQRPIVVSGGRAVIGRPPERVLDL